MCVFFKQNVTLLYKKLKYRQLKIYLQQKCLAEPELLRVYCFFLVFKRLHTFKILRLIVAVDVHLVVLY